MISKMLDVPWNPVKAITNKWKIGAPQWHYEEQDDLLKFTKWQDKTLHGRCQETYGNIKLAAGNSDKSSFLSACDGKNNKKKTN